MKLASIIQWCGIILLGITLVSYFKYEYCNVYICLAGVFMYILGMLKGTTVTEITDKI